MIKERDLKENFEILNLGREVASKVVKDFE